MELTKREPPETLQQQPAAQGQSTLDFFDSSLEWRRMFAETWGRSCWCWLLPVVAWLRQ
jgi:hypothetical protein